MQKSIDINGIVGSCSGWEGYTFDPGTIVRAVNSLIGLEKGAVISGLRAYREQSLAGANRLQDSTRLALLLRVLFVPTSAKVSFPPIRVGTPLDATPPAPGVFPLYPLTLEQDVPLLIVPGFVLGGLPEDPGGHIDFCEGQCALRQPALRPPDNPLGIVETLMSSSRWHRGADQQSRDRGLLRAQVLRLVRQAYPVPNVDDKSLFTHLQSQPDWDAHLRAFALRHPRWDPASIRYVAK